VFTEEVWRRHSIDMRRDRVHKKIEHAFALLARRVHDSHHALCEAFAALALTAEAALAPYDKSSELKFRVIVRRLHAFVSDEGPQRVTVRENICTSSRQPFDVGLLAALERMLKPATHQPQPELEFLSSRILSL